MMGGLSCGTAHKPLRANGEELQVEIKPGGISERGSDSGVDSHGVPRAWADFYAQRAAGQLSDLKCCQARHEAVDGILSGLAAELRNVRRCSEAVLAPGGALQLEAEVHSRLFARSSVVHLRELPDGRVLCATRQGDLGRYDPERGSVDWVGTGLGQVSCMSVLPDDRILVGSVCGRGFSLQMKEDVYDHSFFTWSGRELGPMHMMEGFPDDRVVALAREGVFEWVSSGRPLGARRIEAFPPSSAMAFVSRSELYLLQLDGSILFARLVDVGKGEVLARVAHHAHALRMVRDEAGHVITIGPLGVFRVWKTPESKGAGLCPIAEGTLPQRPLDVQPLKGGGFFAFVEDAGFVINQNGRGAWRMEPMMRLDWNAVAPNLVGMAGAPSLQLRSGKFLAVATTVDRQQFSVLCLFGTGGVTGAAS